MVRIIGVDLLVANPVPGGKNNTVNGVDNSKVIGAKVDVTMTKFKNKNKNLIKLFLAKS